MLRSKTYKRGIEGVNSDHRYWFSPYTLAKVFTMAGLKPEELFFVNYGDYMDVGNRTLNFFFRVIKKLTGRTFSYRSYMGDTLIIIGK